MTGLANHKRLVHKKIENNNLREIKKRTIDKARRLSRTLPVESSATCENCGLVCTTEIGLKLHAVKCKKTTKEV